MALTWNMADGTTRQSHWFHCFDMTNTVGTTPVFPLKTKDSTGQIFYLEEFGLVCQSSSFSGKFAIFDTSKADGNKKICGPSLKQDIGGGPNFVLNFGDDPIVFADASTICISCGTNNTTGATGWIKGYTGL